MSHQQIIEEVQQLLARLPERQALSVRDFAAFLAREEHSAESRSAQGSQVTETAEEFRHDLAAITSHSKAYAFLHDEPDLYSDNDLLERYK